MGVFITNWISPFLMASTTLGRPSPTLNIGRVATLLYPGHPGIEVRREKAKEKLRGIDELPQLASGTDVLEVEDVGLGLLAVNDNCLAREGVKQGCELVEVVVLLGGRLFDGTAVEARDNPGLLIRNGSILYVGVGFLLFSLPGVLGLLPPT